MDARDLIGVLNRRSGRLPIIVRTAGLGERDLDSSSLTLVLLVDPEDEGRLSTEGLAAFGLLTKAEQEVADLLVRGYGTNEIAEKRDTALATTRGQIKAISSKFSCGSRLDLVRLAMMTKPPNSDRQE